MKREIKFRYRYTDGTNWLMSVFTLEETVNGAPFEVLNDSPLRAAYTHVGQDQYTGLKDKNGKDIYEGDILRKIGVDYNSEEYEAWSNSLYEGDGPAPVEINRDVCTLNHFRYWLEKESFGYEGEDLESPEEWEVIGNIYENPELL